jgi:hypothetical protein
MYGNPISRILLFIGSTRLKRGQKKVVLPILSNLNQSLIFQLTAIGLLMAVSGAGANLTAIGAPVIGQLNIVESKKELTVEEYIAKYFSDIPILVEVARCESQFRQHDKNGNTLRGVVNKADKGVMQINEYYHSEKADDLGYDIHTVEGNTAYARHLFEKEGLQPWISSSACWKKTESYANYRKALALNR